MDQYLKDLDSEAEDEREYDEGGSSEGVNRVEPLASGIASSQEVWAVNS